MNYKKVIAIFVLLIIFLSTVAIFLNYYNKKVVISVSQGEKPVTNPLKGWAVWGENSSYKQDVSLAYVLIKWSDLEQQKGVYDFETIEKNFNFKDWKSKNVRFIIRLVCDDPGDTKGNMTIPQWLYDEMDGDGQQYDNNYGVGFAPNYSNQTFIEAHARVIKALAERYNNDPYVAFIQLGSVGHWGEWHVNYGKGINMLPKADVLDRYVQPYLDYFSNKMISIRRPTAIASENNFGLFNDVFGEQEDTQIWLDWIANGYTSDQTEEELPKMKDFWKTAVSGGEISSYESLEYYLGEGFEETYKELEKCHTTYLGPHTPYEFEEDNDFQENMDKMTTQMGYSFTINKIVVENLNKKKDVSIKIFWNNIGIAPIYQNWPICISITGMDGTEYASEVFDSDMMKWVPGTYTAKYRLSNTLDLPKGDYQIHISILDPITLKPAIALAVEDANEDLIYEVGTFSK